MSSPEGYAANLRHVGGEPGTRGVGNGPVARAEGALRTDWRINNRYPGVDEHLALARDVQALVAALREIEEMPSNATVYNAQFIAREALNG